MDNEPEYNPPAFPMLANTRQNSELDLDLAQEGASLRDIFAGQALTGLLAAGSSESHADGGARQAYLFADAMLQERREWVYSDRAAAIKAAAKAKK